MNDQAVHAERHTVTFQPLDRALEVRRGEKILAAALAANFPLPYSCQSGICGSCKAKVKVGACDHGEAQFAGLSASEAEQGYVLLCQATPASDVTVECRTVPSVEGYPVKKTPCRVAALERLADDVMRIRLKLPANAQFKFLPGQYIDVLIPGGIRRSLSIANSPEDEGFIELHLRNYGGPFSTFVFRKLKENDLLRLEGPFGTFFVRDESDKPMILLASGTGFAPIKSIIEHELRKQSGRQMTLYWGGRRPHDLYLDSLAQSWVDQGVNYVPVVSDAQSGDDWGGRSGFVHEAVMKDFADLSSYQVYACGAPVVVLSAKRDFTERCGLSEDEFFADIFVSGATSPA
ncbi:CDP-6-deoxy-delta-3,4-glucoseen reductase [Burkholderia sp. KCJ3K979]|uniref:CDP-6-deoxy-delta-3,4-glucoseen reductase n=1 Tax=Burkholderia sp. KCJ3K979 TaxID=2759149 RepID=UPI0019299E16|nr:CDP-6-deoxy-delta-3,4-glucoseen reductase [Burkholderia sp. KCJ3K979]MBL3960950.1 CDP-6-deoxy-delta-3,4-glucoseen reductase [Burkholderia sp. KCJ3K979]